MVPFLASGVPLGVVMIQCGESPAGLSLVRTVQLKGRISLGFTDGFRERLQPDDVVVAEEILYLRTGERFR